MPAIGMGIGWLGYSLYLWGWCLLRGYDVPLGQLMSPINPYSGKWPPAQIPDTQLFPGGADRPAPAVAAAAPAAPAAPPPAGGGGTTVATPAGPVSMA